MISFLASLYFMFKEGHGKDKLTWYSHLDELLVTINILVDIWMTVVFGTYVNSGEDCIMLRGFGERCSYETFYAFSIIFLLAGITCDGWNAWRKHKARVNFNEEKADTYSRVVTTPQQEYMRGSITNKGKDKEKYVNTLEKFENKDEVKKDLKEKFDTAMAKEDEESDEFMVVLCFICENFPATLLQFSFMFTGY